LTPREAWQPFTPRGVAAFANATLTRVVLAQLAVALTVAAVVIWFLRMTWFPVITEAIQQLPATGMIRNGELNYGGEAPIVLAQNRWLSISIDLASAAPKPGQTADVEARFGRNSVVFCGVLGCWQQHYRAGYLISFNRAELEPRWGAWRGPILAVAALATAAALYVVWWSLALLCAPVIKCIAFFFDRVVTWRGAWRQGAAALLPGAVLVAAGLLLYGFAAVDLFRLGLLYVLHIGCGLAFVVTSPFFLPKLSRLPSRRNPFGTAPCE
jgi:hypothetical protein